ncbi:MAG: class I SAM-dependent methyltransferase [Phycisphaerales bacterium]|nr:MAG: class I SAM-dependent methyltransferase [Phycisphaerales bacterium]
MPSQLKEKPTIERLVKDRPQFHVKPDGSPVSWAVNVDVVRFIYENVKPDMATLETGSGHSTVAFALAGARHIAVTPSEPEGRKILKYCADIGIQPHIRFLHEQSDLILPRSDEIPPELDFVFIDGAHYFPVPCIDFHYTAPRLKVGGIMGVDDIFMPSVRILYDFLCAEDDWELVRQIRDTAFFRQRRKRNSQSSDPWATQGINKAFWQRKLKRERSRWRWAVRLPIRILKNPRRYLGRRGQA